MDLNKIKEELISINEAAIDEADILRDSQIGSIKNGIAKGWTKEETVEKLINSIKRELKTLEVSKAEQNVIIPRKIAAIEAKYDELKGTVPEPEIVAPKPETPPETVPSKEEPAPPKPADIDEIKPEEKDFKLTTFISKELTPEQAEKFADLDNKKKTVGLEYDPAAKEKKEKEYAFYIPADVKKDLVIFVNNVYNKYDSEAKRAKIPNEIIEKGYEIFKNSLARSGADSLTRYMDSLRKMAINAIKRFQHKYIWDEVVQKSDSTAQANAVMIEGVKDLIPDIIKEGFKRLLTGRGERKLQQDLWSPLQGARLEDKILTLGISGKIRDIKKSIIIAISTLLGKESNLGDVSLNKEIGDTGKTIGDTIADGTEDTDELIDRLEKQELAAKIPEGIKKMYQDMGVKLDIASEVAKLNEPLIQ